MRDRKLLDLLGAAQRKKIRSCKKKREGDHKQMNDNRSNPGGRKLNGGLRIGGRRLDRGQKKETPSKNMIW